MCTYTYRIKPLTQAEAKLISKWEYPGEYALYSFDGGEETLAELMCGEYYACADANGELAGYFCYGGSARIPVEGGYSSDEAVLDIGLGLAPGLCGMGRGYGFMQSGMAYARDNFNIRGLRLVVAAFNKRAIALYERCGFVKLGTVLHSASKMEFYVMERGL